MIENDVKTDIALIKKDLTQIEKSLSKLDSLLQKFEDTNQKIFLIEASFRMLEQKVSSIHDSGEIRKREAEASSKELKMQMLENKSETEEFLHGKMEKIFFELKELRTDTTKSFLIVAEDMKKQKHDIDMSVKALETRLNSLENWKWWVMGVATAVTSLITFIWKNILG
jgi:chromosome segregation ATPase